MTAPGDRPGRFLRWWYPWAFWEQCLLIYPVYALLIEDSGIDPVAIASLFMVWSVAAFIAEVPSGVLADRFPRHRVLLAGALLRASAFSVWLLAPTYSGFFAGFVLWGVASALHSGTRQALLYEHLEQAGVRERFQHCWGRTNALHSAGGATALAIGGFVAQWNMAAPLVASIALSLASALVAGCFFAADRRPVAAGHDRPAMLRQLKLGIHEALSRRVVLIAVVALALAPVAINAYEEFVPLFLRERDATLAQIGMIFAFVYLGHVAGAVLSERLDPVHERSGYRGALVWMLFGGSALAAAAALPGWWSVAGLLAAFFAWGVFSVSLQARLQQAIRDRSRATITSLASFGELGSAQLVYLGIGFAGLAAGWAGATLMAGCLLIAITLALALGVRLGLCAEHTSAAGS